MTMTTTKTSRSNSEIYSFSKLSCFSQCRYQYYLKYVLPKSERPPAKENAFSLYGQFVHGLLEQYENGDIPLEDLPIKYEEEFDVMVSEEFPPSPNPKISLFDSYYDSGLKFLRGYKGQAPKYTVEGVEEYFTEDIDGIQVRGFIDLELKDNSDGSIVIHDWKSKSSIKTNSDKKKYGRQLYLYSKHIFDKYGVWPKTLRLYLFRKDEPVDIQFTMDGYNEAVEWMKNQVLDINTCMDWDEYNYDKFFCNHLCEFRESCKWKEIAEFDCQQGGNSKS